MIHEELEPCQLVLSPSGTMLKLHYQVDGEWSASVANDTSEDGQLSLTEEWIKLYCTLL